MLGIRSELQNLGLGKIIERYDGLPSPSMRNPTDFQVRPCGIRRTRKSVVLFNQQSGKRGLAKIAPRLPASGCESSLLCLQPNVTSCESLTDIQTELGS
jgi:hypothetical protein